MVVGALAASLSTRSAVITVEVNRSSRRSRRSA